MSSDLEIWNGVAQDWSNKVTLEDSLRTLLIIDALNTLLPDVAGKEVLDVGCGDGFFSNWLYKHEARTTGIDGSSKMVVIAKQKFPNLEFFQANALEPLSFGPEKFDMVLANMLLMHLSSIDIFLSEAHRILKKEGNLIVSVLHPTFNYPTAKLHKSLWQKLVMAKPFGLSFDYFDKPKALRRETVIGKNLTHYHRTMEEYSQAFSQAGFAIEQILEPHTLPESFLLKNPKLEYATRLPRFIFFKLFKH